MTLQDLFAGHIETLQKRMLGVFSELGIDSLVLDAGVSQYYFEDDQGIPFRSNHHFAHWCPHPGEGHLLHIKPGQKPKLLAFAPDDFWHEHKKIAQDFWTDQFEIESYGDRDELWKAINMSGRNFYHGPEAEKAQSFGLETSIEELLPRLNWYRSYKTAYELACVSHATERATKGHHAAEKAFLAGGSELDIHFAYLHALRALDEHLPYAGIVCLNEKGATLHYRDKRDDVRNGVSLLIDSGAAFQGYACDITRTYASPKAPAAFHELLTATQTMQKNLCESVKAGITMADLHFESHIEIAKILLDQEILKGISVEDAVSQELTRVFYPHGVGHMLGLLVHDVAGKQVDLSGKLGEPDPRFPKLRSVRVLEADHLITVEPGIYFIDILLKAEQSGSNRDKFNWPLIETLRPCGGIRIEDNVVVTKDQPLNITRKFLGDTAQP